jgi:flagellar protein FliJ
MTDTLSVLLEQAEAQRNTALAAFNQSRQRRDAARDQLHELQRYQADYTARWNRQFHQQGAALEIVRSYHQFADRLQLALAQQAHALNVAEQALTRANDTLAAHELRVASVRKLIERRAAETRQRDERREQRHDDEIAQRLAALRRAAAPQGLQP